VFCSSIPSVRSYWWLTFISSIIRVYSFLLFSYSVIVNYIILLIILICQGPTNSILSINSFITLDIIFLIISNVMIWSTNYMSQNFLEFMSDFIIPCCFFTLKISIVILKFSFSILFFFRFSFSHICFL